MTPQGATVWTIVHSTRDWPVFLAMLQQAGIETLADVRRFAGSRSLRIDQCAMDEERDGSDEQRQ